MSIVASGADYSGAPRNYAELFKDYRGFVRKRVIAKGIEERNADDVTGDLLLRFMERGSLEKYDPTLTFDRAGKMRTATFKTYIGGFVDMNVQGHRDRQRKRRSREPLVCDMSVESDNGGTVTWAELNEETYGTAHPGHEEDVLDVVMAEGLIESMRAFLSDIPPRNAYDKCDLVAVLDGVVEQILDKGVLDFEVLAEKLNVSPTSVNKYYWRMRELLCEATGRPVPKKRPRTTKAKPDPQP